ncbi:acetyl esterase/lipase [Chryseobacterium rhizosphaerae]|uniref:Acetyl esterase/lipase n=1 Tax=Chryseobacterium rhizosphaerae TaxID=395937 RepID=A0AAE3Y8W4_9FLAO|nr:alpha/beta hydrolase [Chryseobacterium rhizosphaerae]MDR6527125.1 acetyl esterase/lipase [Chryseobacterium rhizosphaerae]
MRKKVIFIVASLHILFLLLNCKEKKVSLGGGIHFDKEEDIHYGNDPEQIMDLYLPHENPSKKRAAFIIIHGGGWRSGDKSQLTFFTLSMMQKFPDHIFANINYRPASTTQYAIPNQMEDIKNAAGFLKKKLHYAPQLILLGNSAGGHLSMMYAYHFDPLKNVKSVINIVGPADLSDEGFKTYEEYSFVEKHLIDPKILPAGIAVNIFSSPVQWITPNIPPTLSYYGKTDRVIPLSQKRILDSVLNKNNVMNESYEFNGGHLDWDKEPNSIFLMEKIEKFLKRVN